MAGKPSILTYQGQQGLYTNPVNQQQPVAEPAKQQSGNKATEAAWQGSMPMAPVVQQQPTAPAPYQNSWSLQGGFDMSGPGAAEDAYARYGSQLAAPSASEAYNNTYNPVAARGQTATGAFTSQYNPMGQQSALGQYNNPGAMDASRNATASGQYWNSVQGQSNAPKDMSGYYDRASERTASGINRQASARGMYNSSAAMDQLGRAESDLRGQQARDEAQYGLQSAQVNDSIQRGAATAADSAGLGRFNAGAGIASGLDQFGLDRYRTGLTGAGQADSAGNAAFGAGLSGAQAADAGRTGRLGLLGSGAMAADSSRQGRVGSVYDNLATLSGGLAGTLGAGYNDMFNTDQWLFDMTQQMGLGSGLANLNNAQNVGALGMSSAQGMGNTFAGAGQDVQNVLSMTSKSK